MVMSGGWMIHEQLDDEAKTIFNTAMKDWVGVGYEPVAYATQATHPVNYAFLCIGTTSTLEPHKGFYVVYLNEDATRPHRIQEIPLSWA